MLYFNVLFLNVFCIAPLVYPRNPLKIELYQLHKQVNLVLNALIGLHEKSAARNESHNTSFSFYPTAAMKGHFQNLFLIKVLIISKEPPTGRVSLVSHLDKVLNCPLSNSANIRPMLAKQANTVLSGDLAKVKETKVENQTRYNKTNKEDFSTVRHVIYLNSGCQFVQPPCKM